MVQKHVLYEVHTHKSNSQPLCSQLIYKSTKTAVCECARNVPPPHPTERQLHCPRNLLSRTIPMPAKQVYWLLCISGKREGEKKKQREKQETKTCSSNLSAGTGRLVETFHWSFIRQPATPTVSAKVTAAAWFHHLASACCVFPSLDLSLFFWPPPPPPPHLLFWRRVEGERRKTLHSISGPDSHKYLQTSHFTSPAQELLKDC